MPLPISKKQLNRLGERIAAVEPPGKEDLDLFNEVLRAYQTILVTVEEQLTTIGLTSTSRIKTRSVLIEKLRRERGMDLARVQDLAGARTIIEGGWAEQDAVVAALKSHFDGWTAVSSRVVDRRTRPSHGYRAVHLIVFPERVPVEIQIRTHIQNDWAQIVERLADRWGRGVRYGEDPENAYLPAEGVTYPDGSPVTRQRIVHDLRNIADQIAGIEATEREIESALNVPVQPLESRIVSALGRDIVDLNADSARFYSWLRRAFKRVVTDMRRSDLMAVASREVRSRLAGRRHVGRLVRRTVPDVTAPDADFVRGQMLKCDAFVDNVVADGRSQLKQQHATLRDTLQELRAYVEQGGIR